jgi:hypothetical protein
VLFVSAECSATSDHWSPISDQPGITSPPPNPLLNHLHSTSMELPFFSTLREEENRKESSKVEEKETKHSSIT